ncbi:MAG TPA: hypothetical protein VFG72_04280 [Marmoricola sp.]|nr:hypothetical protein [Marmoricola sp.]
MTPVSERVYLPMTATRLREALERGSFGPAPLRGHAVTPAVVAALDDDEEREYAALTAASLVAVAHLTDDDPPLRLVAAVDVTGWDADQGDDPTVVWLPHEVPWKRLAAVLADSPDAADAVARAWAEADAEDDAFLEACLDHELGWFAVQEVDALLAGLGV